MDIDGLGKNSELKLA